jgi:hypothetical protein
MQFEDFFHASQTCQIEWAEQLDGQISSHQMNAVNPAAFNYLAPLSIYLHQKPYLHRLPALTGFARTNIVSRKQPVQIFEVSGHEHLFTLDSSGFEFTSFDQPIQAWTDSFVCTIYMPKMAVWLKEYLGCAEVHLYAYSVS